MHRFFSLLFILNLSNALKWAFWKRRDYLVERAGVRIRQRTLGSPRFRLIDVAMSDDDDEQHVAMQQSLKDDKRPVRLTHEDFNL